MSGTSSPLKAPPRSEPHAHLAQFTLSLIKCMLHSGYYAPDHPETQKDLACLHEEFRQLVEDRSELTYMITMTGEERGIIIEGYDSAPLPLDKVMKTNMADLFMPKFLEFFDRWNLISFSLKADISAEEFHSFLILMSRPPEAHQGTKEASERLTQALLDHHVLHISTVFSDDIVGKDRRLPWRVKMALSRLRRDLRMLPLYKHATPEELQRIKLQIMDDVIRPVRTPGVLKEFLINCDLLAADMAAVVGETQIERRTVESLSEEMLAATAWDLVKDLEQLSRTQGQMAGDRSCEERTRRVHVLREVMARLYSIGGALDHDLLEALLKQQALPMEDLPVEIQRVVETHRLADGFETRKDEYSEALSQIEPGEAGRQLTDMVRRVLPELVRRRHYEAVMKVLEAVNKGQQGSTPSEVLEELAQRLSEGMASEGTIGHLLRDLDCQDKERRNRLVEILAFIGDPAGPGLLEAYAGSDNKSVRVSAFEAMKRIGTSALQPFLARLSSIEREWGVICHILAAVGEQRDTSLTQLISRFLHHGHLHVREAAVRALFKLHGPAAEGYFLEALRDREGAVRGLALWYLGHIKSRHPQALKAYEKALQSDDPSAPPENEPALIQVCHALASFERLAADDTGKAETMLLAALRPVEQKGVLSWLKKPSPRHSEGARAAICEALAAVGSSAAIAPLRQVADTDEAPVATKAAAAADRIQQRYSRSPAA